MSMDDSTWRSFVSGLPITSAHLAAVIHLWDALILRLAPSPWPLPLTQMTATGNVQLAWDTGRHYVEVDILPDGTQEWFYRDRKTNVLDGTDEPEAGVSSMFVDKVRKIQEE